MKDRVSRTTTYLALIISMALWGGTWTAGRALGGQIHPVNAAFLRMFIASLVLLPVSAFGERRSPFFPSSQILGLLFLAATGVFGYSTLFFSGLQYISSSRAALIVASTPVCISLASVLFMREKLGLIGCMGVALSLAGVIFLIANGHPESLAGTGLGKGDLAILGCVVCWTAYSLGGKAVMAHISPLKAVTWSCVIGSVMLLPFALASGLVADVSSASTATWSLLAFLGVFATAVAYYAYYRAVSVIGAPRAGIFINTVPVFAVIFGALFLNERIGLSLMVGGLMIVSGVYLKNVRWGQKSE